MSPFEHVLLCVGVVVWTLDNAIRSFQMVGAMRLAARALGQMQRSLDAPPPPTPGDEWKAPHAE